MNKLAKMWMDLFDMYGGHHDGCDRSLLKCSCGMRDNYRAVLIETQASEQWTHYHPKRDKKYRVVGMARAQCSTMPISDGDMLTLYIGEDGVYSVRLPAEFGDGRFESLQATEAPVLDKIE